MIIDSKYIPKCKACNNSADIIEKITDFVGDHVPCEKSYTCGKCNNVVAYWAYGHWDESFEE